MSLPALWDQKKKKKKKGHELSPKYGQIYYHGEGLWNENISCHINQQEMSQPSVISDVNKGSHPVDAATPDSDQRGACGMQEARWTMKPDWPQRAEVHLIGMNSVSPEACVFPYIEC